MGLTGVLDQVWSPAATAENALCSRFRCAKSECTACVKTCPLPKTILLSDHGAEITSRCVGCGACASVCPNGAIRMAEPDRVLAARMGERTEKGRPFRAACARGTGAVDLVVLCLSRLTEALLLEPIRHGADRVELLEPGCAGCVLEKAGTVHETMLHSANNLCESLGLGAGRITGILCPVRDWPSDSLPLRDGDPPLSRRALLQAFTLKTANVAAAALPNLEGGEPAVDPFREKIRKHAENIKRSHLLEVVRALAGEESATQDVSWNGAPFAAVEVNSNCTGCNVCETLCPVGALARREEKGIFALEFEPALCTGCGVCEVACFPRAIRVRETLVPSALLDRRAHALIRARRQTCAACGGDFLGNEAGLCSFCLKPKIRPETVARQWASVENTVRSAIRST